MLGLSLVNLIPMPVLSAPIRATCGYASVGTLVAFLSLLGVSWNLCNIGSFFIFFLPLLEYLETYAVIKQQLHVLI